MIVSAASLDEAVKVARACPGLISATSGVEVIEIHTPRERIVACYELLERQAPSVLHTLNRALAIAEWKGPEAALEVLAGRAPPSWLEGSWQWLAVFADLHRRAGHVTRATEFREAALAAAPSVAVREALTRRLGR
jgi:RNA polymerase sigma-70 factor (ECF subfamily)